MKLKICGGCKTYTVSWWILFYNFFRLFQHKFTWSTSQKLNFEKIFKNGRDTEFRHCWNYLRAICPKRLILEEKVVSVTPHNEAKIRGLIKTHFCSKTNRLWEIVKKTFFSNFALLSGHIGHTSRQEPLKIGMDHLFVSN